MYLTSAINACYNLLLALLRGACWFSVFLFILICMFLVTQSKFVEELAQQGRIRELILDQYANYVVQRALTVANNEEGLKLVAAIRPHLHSMQVWTAVVVVVIAQGGGKEQRLSTVRPKRRMLLDAPINAPTGSSCWSGGTLVA